MSRMEGNDLDLVDKARAGDTDAFRELVDRHSQTMFKTAFRLTGNEADADDLVQETLIRAMGNLALFGTRGMPAHRYPSLLSLIAGGHVDLSPIVAREVALSDTSAELVAFNGPTPPGVAVITDFLG